MPWPIHGVSTRSAFAALFVASALLAPAVSAGGLETLPAQPLAPAAAAALKSELAARRGQAVVINFWASWCEPCREEMPALQQLAARWKGRGLTVLTVAMGDSPRQVEDFLWEISAELPVVHDREQTTGRAWGVRVLPTTFVIDARRRVRMKALGPVDWSSKAVDVQLGRVLSN